MGLFKSKESVENKTPIEVYGEQIKELLLEGESIDNIYPTIFEFLCITNKRVIFVDSEINLKEQSTTIITIPFGKIDSIGIVKNNKAFALTNEIVINTRSGKYDIKILKANDSIMSEIYRLLSSKIL